MTSQANRPEQVVSSTDLSGTSQADALPSGAVPGGPPVANPAQPLPEDANNRYRDLYDRAPVGYCTLSATGCILEANRTLATLLGVPQPALLNQPLARFVLDHDQDLFAQHRAQLLSTAAVQTCELRLVRADQPPFWARLESTLDLQEANSPECRVVLSDITGRKEAELAWAKEATRRRNMIEQSPDGILIIDPDSQRFLEFNTAAHQQLGYSRAEFAQLRIADLEVMETEAATAARIDGVQRDGRADFETLQRARNGEIRHVHVTAQMLDIQGRPGYHCVWRDITERKQAEKALRESEAAVRKKLATILEPEGDIGTLELADLIDAPALQTMIEQVCRITNMGGGVAIVDDRGTVLVAAGWQDICTKFHRMHPDTQKNCQESDTVLSRGIPAGMCKAYRCKNNLWDIATPIVIGGRHLGNVFVGQFFYDDEVIDHQLFRQQARHYGFNEGEYLAALDRIPRWSHQAVEAAMSFYGSLAKMISSLSYSTIKLARALSQKEVALHQLDESKAFQTSLLETMPIPVFYKDTAGRYLGFNRAFEDFYGKTKAHLIGKSVFELYPAELAQIYAQQDAELFQQQKSQVYESKLTDARGTLHDVIFHKASLVDTQGVIIGLVGAIIDVTQRNRAEDEKKSLQQQLIQAQRMEAIGTLAGGIAHDFNNILSAIIGFTELACESLPPGSAALKSLGKVMSAGQRASGLVKQILTFSRQSVTELLLLQPAIIIKEALKILRPSLPATIIIQQQIDAATRPIFADPTEIHQILMNLCTNAFHAMELTGGVLDITLQDIALFPEDLHGQPDVRPGNFVVLAIGDSGQGIPPEIQEKMFNPYFTTKEVGKGTGMGLSIVHGIVKKYGGFVTCRSTQGIGTVFHVFFPAVEQEVAAVAQPMDAVVPLGKERILFVDDEAMLVDWGRTVLAGLGYEVTVKTSGQEALAAFRRHPNRFDAIVTDHTMPGMTGIDLARQVLQLQPDMPIILCTGYSTLVNEEQAKAAGIRGFALKPLSKQAIAVLLRKMLDAARPPR